MRLALVPCLFGLASMIGCSAPPPAPPPAAPSSPPPVASASATPGPPAPPATIQLGGGCEEAKNVYLKECQERPASCADREKPAGVAAVTSILNEGNYLTGCGTPLSTALKICAAIRGGHAVAVTVTTDPGDPRLANCIGKAVQGLAFPDSPRLDVTSTTFAAQ